MRIRIHGAEVWVENWATMSTRRRYDVLETAMKIEAAIISSTNKKPAPGISRTGTQKIVHLPISLALLTAIGNEGRGDG